MEDDYKHHTTDPAPLEEVFVANETGYTSSAVAYLSNTGPSQFFTSLISLTFSASILACCFGLFPIRPYFVLTSIAGAVIVIVPFLLGFPNYAFVGKGRPIYVVMNGLIMLQPAFATLVDFSCDTLGYPRQATTYLFLFIISLLIFALFAKVSYIFRATLATFVTIIMALFLSVNRCNVSLNSNGENSTQISTNVTLMITPGQLWLSNLPVLIFSEPNLLFFEAVISIVSVTVMIWLVARESELAARLNWYAAAENGRTAYEIQDEQNQAETLACSIIPPRIINEIFDNQGQLMFYSQQHNNCGVMFASIKNFSDIYEESFKGGEGYLRYLNELFSDFESLLKEPKFKDIEKIKTIGPCLMVASGLDNDQRYSNQDPKAHLYSLLDYGFALIATLNEFNKSIPGDVKFKLYIGFNAGPLVSGVIGSVKLHYDIWGDTVNVASRMYSTGKEGRIQTPDNVAEMLGAKFKFELRGKIAVKGKPDMTTYFVVEKKPGAKWH